MPSMQRSLKVRLTKAYHMPKALLLKRTGTLFCFHFRKYRTRREKTFYLRKESCQAPDQKLSPRQRNIFDQLSIELKHMKLLYIFRIIANLLARQLYNRN